MVLCLDFYYRLLVIASSQISPIFSTHTRKKGVPGIYNRGRDVGPYTRVGSVADRENRVWASTISSPLRVSARIATFY